MSKEKVYITLFEDDGQVDVEVYEWNETTEEKGKLLAELTDYAFSSRLEAQEHIDNLKKDYDIIKETSWDEEEKAFEEQLKDVEFKPLKPLYQTYELQASELTARANYELSKQFNYPITVEVGSPEDSDAQHYVEIIVEKENHPEWVLQNIERYYDLESNSKGIDVSEDVMNLLFPNYVEFYWHPNEYSVIVHVGI